MYKKLLSILVLIVIVASTLVGCSGSGTPCSTLTILSVTDGDVLVMKEGTNDWGDVQVGMELEAGDTLKTGEDSGAEITFFDGTTIELQAGTQIEILSLDIVCSTGITTITLMQTIGTTISRVTHVLDPASRYEVGTPSGVAGVRGSTMIVRVLEDGTTLVTNVEGTVYAKAQGEEVEVPVDQTYVIYPGQPPLISGALVPGFGMDGAVTSNPSDSYDEAYAIAIDSTAMYVVGYTVDDGDAQWRIEKRSLADGSLDEEFGVGGVVTSNNGTGFDVAYDIAIDSTYMYVVGYDNAPGNEQWRIEKRSLVDGSLDTGFDGDGVVTSNPSGSWDEAHAIAIDSTAMYVVGIDQSPGPVDHQWRIEKRSLVDGSLDTGFDGDGVVMSNPSTGYDWAYDIAIDSTYMYVVGFDLDLGNSQWRIEKRSLSDGSLDTGFGEDGHVLSNPSVGYDDAYAIAIDSTAMYVVGSDSYQWRIEKRSLESGDILGFGAITSDSTEHPSDIAIDSTAMYVVGSDYSPGDAQWRIEKRSLADGGLDTGFGIDGLVSVDPSTGDDGSGDDVIYGVAMDSTAIYVVGVDRSPGDSQWRIEKRVK
jgi:hypothetical protein